MNKSRANPSNLIWLMLLTSSNLVSTQNVSHAKPKSIFILAGQSNMSGRGGVTNGTWDGIVPPQCQSNSQILRLNYELKWETAHEPLHRDINVNKTCGIGPGMVFANSILERECGIGVIGLVPCAIGGTSISKWARGSRLYNQLVVRAWATLNHGGLIRGILWYQGESDTENRDDARLYKGRLKKFFTDVRSDLKSPMLPVVQVALASGKGKYLHVVRKAQLEIDLPNVRCVDAKGLQLQPDGLHLGSAAQVQLGKMLADAFLQIMAPLPVQSNPSKRFHNFFLNCNRNK
ncbi:hypothetical protein ACJIZ3_009209 [Penstemon smallii]|uniref:Sialate O-acetylesterase domain-containing protein n=1 Tax=Penstemon smallii TaxID=265156 RepID=A0ABD3TD36_9LAMI